MRGTCEGERRRKKEDAAQTRQAREREKNTGEPTHGWQTLCICVGSNELRESTHTALCTPEGNPFCCGGGDDGSHRASLCLCV